MAAKQILVVDDDQSIRALVSKILSKAGHEVRTVSSGQAAVQTVTKQPFDLILMDMNMADWDGSMAAGMLSMAMPKQKILLVTGLDDPKQLNPVLKHKNVVGLVKKPFSPANLQAEVEKALAIEL